MKNIPNLITILRFILVAPILYLLYIQRYEFALWLFMIAAASDALDGYLARLFQSTSYIGSILDPIANKSLIVGSFIALYLLSQIPLWLLLVVFARDVIIVVGAIAYYFLITPYPFNPTMISKLNTVVQLALVTLELVNLTYQIIPHSIELLFMYIVATLTITSCVDYVWVWGCRAWQSK